MINKPSRAAAREKRHYRIRNHVKGTAERPRLAVFRSNKHMYAQIIDDVKHHTLAAASTVEAEVASKVELQRQLLWVKLSLRRLWTRALQKSFSTEAVSFTTAR